MMQIFIPYNEPIKVAKCLDDTLLHKQILEARSIVAAIENPPACKNIQWRKHPIMKMYKDHTEWLSLYADCLQNYRIAKFFKRWNDYDGYHTFLNYAIDASSKADRIRPCFVVQEICDQHKSRLYTKYPKEYPFFKEYGISNYNCYYVDGRLRQYKERKKKNGK